MDTSQITNNDVSWKFLIPYRIISILFAIIATFTFGVSIVVPPGKVTFLCISFMFWEVMLIYGFWKMRKWVVTLMGIVMIFIAFNNIVRVFQGMREIIPTLPYLLFLSAVLIFSYISRSQLNGEYKNIRVIRVFVVFLILSQVLLILSQ